MTNIEQEIEAIAEEVRNRLRRKQRDQLRLKDLPSAPPLDEEPDESAFDGTVLKTPGPLQPRARDLETVHAQFQHFCNDSDHPTSTAIRGAAWKVETGAIAEVRAFGGDKDRLDHALAAIDLVGEFYKAVVAVEARLKKKRDGG